MMKRSVKFMESYIEKNDTITINDDLINYIQIVRDDAVVRDEKGDDNNYTDAEIQKLNNEAGRSRISTLSVSF